MRTTPTLLVLAPALLALAFASASACAPSSSSSFSSPVGTDAGLFPESDAAVSGDDGGPVNLVSFGSGSPSLPATVSASTPPPPISGGTLLATRDGTHAVAADPDRDVVYGVDLVAKTVTFTVKLQAGDEPGRLIEDGAGRVHVALRRGGALATLDAMTGDVVARRNVCPAPRGVAWDSTTDLVWVACATGEIVALPSAGGAATTTWNVERDLRDIVVDNGSVSVTQFRSAQVLRLGNAGSIGRRDRLTAAIDGFLPHVAWRVVPAGNGALLASYQQSTSSSVTTQSQGVPVQGGYGGGCGSGPAFPDAGPITLPPGPPPSPPAASTGEDGGFSPFVQGCAPPVITSVLSVMASDGSVSMATSVLSVLPVDVALSPDGSTIAVASAGNAYSPMATVMLFAGLSADGVTTFQPTSGIDLRTPDGISRQPTAVAFDGDSDLLVQTREPAMLWVQGASGALTPLTLSTTSRADTGIDVFHTQAGLEIACASCHPEGGDDGHVWLLNGDKRRTPSLRGTIAGTAPYHWPGDEPTMDALVADVYVNRMGGSPLEPAQTTALEHWVDAIPAPPPPSWLDSASAARGRTLFTRADVGCTTCHAGAKLTNNLTLDVGTGGAFQVPPLVGVGWRTPLLHDGCAATIADRFGACATPQHGNLGALSAQDLVDLGNYLESL